MKFRTLLLGTAAAFAVVGGAKAADLAAAEPIDYVKVCDAYGVGYWFIPGTDTCLRIGGYVQFDTNFYSTSKALNADASDPSATNDPSEYDANWRFYTETQVDVTAQSMTDYGSLVGFIAMRTHHDAKDYKGINNLAYLDTAYLKIGPLLAGYQTSTYDYGAGFGLIGPAGGLDHDQHNNLIQLSWNMSGWGLWLGIEDPRDDPGGSALYTGDMPDLIAAITGSMGGLDWKASAGVSDTIYGTGWGAQLGATYAFSGGDKFRLKGAVSNDAGEPFANGKAPNGAGGTWWSVVAAAVHYWTPTVSTALTFDYTDGPGSADSLWEASAEADWTIAKNMDTGISVIWQDGQAVSGTWTVDWRLIRHFGS